MTPYGRICILKSLSLSKLEYVAQIMAEHPKHKLKEIDNIFKDFIWGSTDNVKKFTYERVCLDDTSGGLGMRHTQTFWEALHLSWAKRTQPGYRFWKEI